MHDNSQTIAELGDEPPLSGDGQSGPPDRREISARWLSGTFLTGVTSCVLMGVALSAALNGREILATPPEIAKLADMGDGSGEAAKAARVLSPRAIAKPSDKHRMEVSTVIRSGDRDVIRTVPFVDVKMALAAGHTTDRDYPPFDPTEVFADDGSAPTANTGLIYGAKVESEVSLKTVDFPIETAKFEESSELSADEVETVVRTASAVLDDGAVQIAALRYVNPQRFGQVPAASPPNASYGVRIVPENMSVSPRERSSAQTSEFAEDIIPFTTDKKILDAFRDAGYSEDEASGMAEAISKLLSTKGLKAGTVLRLGIVADGDEHRIVRASIYDHDKHVVTIAVDDRGQYVPADEPEPNPEVATAFEDSPPVSVRGELPSAYDGIYRSAFSYGLSAKMTRRLIKLLASDVDFQSRLTPSDRLEVLFSRPEKDDSASPDSELLYVKASFGGNVRTYYRFQMEDGTVDYFDKDGKSARQFLIRNPVPGARLSRGFGRQRHPILGYTRMHTGVDWAIKRGTPIMAAGNGVIEKAGRSSGYGNLTIIRHPNGYETYYGHQTSFAKGIAPGVHVRQGQIIGYVGSTGLSTGPHVHFEIRINDRPVDPLRVRLPVGRTLKSEELEAFNRERKRIDDLLREQDQGPLSVASAGLDG